MSWLHSSLMVIALLSSGCLAEKKEVSQQLDERINESLLNIAGQEPEVGSFIARNPEHGTEITILYPENITQLSEKYPAIYGNLPNRTLYRIEYRSERGMLVIIDRENKKVLRYFRTAGVKLE